MVPFRGPSGKLLVQSWTPNRWYQLRACRLSMFVDHQLSSCLHLLSLNTAWSSGFPISTPDPSQLPPQWVNALNAAITAGKIPNIPPTIAKSNISLVYPNGLNPNDPEVCSATFGCRAPGDIWDGPKGYFITSFDDGPLPVSTTTLAITAVRSCSVSCSQQRSLYNSCKNRGRPLLIS
jgi:hypothetical protein